MEKVVHHLKQLLALKPTTRPWHLPFVAALCAGGPVLTGAVFGRADLGITACLGALVILYIRPALPIPQRMIMLAACSFGFSACFALGLTTSFNVFSAATTLGVVALLATCITRYYALPPPGNFFFVLVTALAHTRPFELELIPLHVGLITLGGILACTLAFLYSLSLSVSLKEQPPSPPVPLLNPSTPNQYKPRLHTIVLESIVTGLFVGGSYLLAVLVGLENPYWVPISCCAIMQGSTFTMIWHRQVHRILGTTIGMVLAWGILSLPLNPWLLGAVIILLNFIIEFLVVRNYGLAVIFITPMTLLLADAASTWDHTEALILARLLDIILGSIAGFVGGWVLHRSRGFAWAEKKLLLMTDDKPPEG